MFRCFLVPLLVFAAAILGVGRCWTKPPNSGAGKAPPPKPVYNYDYELVPADDLKVRIPQPPEEYDPKTGEIKRYRLDELEKMKGDDPAERKLFGYKGAFKDVKIGDGVEVFLATPKEAPKTEEGADPKTSWKRSGQIIGTVTDTAEKSFTVRVHNKVLGNGFTRVLDRQATLIVVLKRAAKPVANPDKTGTPNPDKTGTGKP